MSKILLINGPNMDLLGERAPEVYGRTTLHDVEMRMQHVAAELGVELTCFQSNSEGEIVSKIAWAKRQHFSGIVMNPAAYTHSSIAIRDAVEASGLPVIEIHISNIHAREAFRHHSMIAPCCLGQVVGLGTDGYEWALRALVRHLNSKPETTP